MTTSTVPDSPCLVRGYCTFEFEGRLVIRATRGAFQVEPQHRAAIERVLPRLDGTRYLSDVFRGERPTDVFYMLRLFGWFVQNGMITNGPDVLAGATMIPKWVPRRSFVMIGEGLLSLRLAQAIVTDGGTVQNAVDFLPTDATLLCVLDRPDLAALERINARALQTGAPLLPVFALGDSIVVGPRVECGNGPCFGCFLRRWLGLSPSIVLERAYLDRARAGSSYDTVLSDEEATTLASHILAAVLRCMFAPAAPGSMTLVARGSGGTIVSSVHPHPWCEDCKPWRSPLVSTTTSATAFSAGAWTEEPVPFDQFAEEMRDLSGWPCGFAALAPRPPGRRALDDARFPKVAVARFALPEPDAVDVQSNWSHGAAATMNEARAFAIAEAIERYAGLSPMAADVTACYDDVRHQALLPLSLPLFSDTQYTVAGFPFSAFDPSEPISWSWARNTTSGSPILVPTAAAWYGHDDSLVTETSSGIAAHTARGQALLAGALEVIERDAFMIHWLNRLSPPLLELDTVTDPGIRARIEHIERMGYAVHVADISTDLCIPVCLAMGIREDKRAPALIVGAAADFSVEAALLRALDELFSATLTPTRLWKLRPPLEAGAVTSLHDHSRCYEHPSWLQHASFLWSASSGRRPVPSSQRSSRRDADTLTSLVARLASHGYDLIGIDLTPPDLRNCRIRIVRAIIPGLQPLGFGSRLRLGGRRLYEAPVRMGYRCTPAREDELYRMPHCFP